MTSGYSAGLTYLILSRIEIGGSFFKFYQGIPNISCIEPRNLGKVTLIVSPTSVIVAFKKSPKLSN